MLTIYFERRSEMTAFANHSGCCITRTKKPCNHVETGRSAILLSDGDTIVAELIYCRVCHLAQFGKELPND